MYVQSRFKMPGVSTLRLTHSHFRVIVKAKRYQALAPKLALVFFENYEKISLIHRIRKGDQVHILVLWREGGVDKY